jgi:hypothetical protein
VRTEDLGANLALSGAGRGHTPAEEFARRRPHRDVVRLFPAARRHGDGRALAAERPGLTRQRCRSAVLREQLAPGLFRPDTCSNGGLVSWKRCQRILGQKDG